jgi:hypothetical protein
LSVSCNKSQGRAALHRVKRQIAAGNPHPVAPRSPEPARLPRVQPSTNHRPKEHAMNTSLPATPVATRFNALAAALVVTLAMLSGIDTLASAEGSASLMAGSGAAAAQRS